MTIEINLIPPNLRKKKKGGIANGINIPLEVLIGSAGALLVLLVLAHFSLLFINMNELAKYRELQKEWKSILPAKENVEVVISELRGLQERDKAIKAILDDKTRIIWSQKLNILSDSLPKGVWLRKIVLNEEMFLIEGSAISRQKKEMINVHRLTANLKKEENFLNYLSDLELDAIQRRRIKKIEIADFIITTKLQKGD